MESINAMFSDLQEEMDLLMQGLECDIEPPETALISQREKHISIGFTDLNESLNDLEENDLDALMGSLSKLNASEEDLVSGQRSTSTPCPNDQTPPTVGQEDLRLNHVQPSHSTEESCSAMSLVGLQTKADKVKLALDKLREAKVRKLVVKVWISDDGSKILMVDERQTVRQVLDNLFEKTHCDRSVDWSLCETNPELQTERSFEDHENLVESVSAWTRDTKNKLCFVQRPQKYEIFKEPQTFYMWKRDKRQISNMTERAKENLVKENFQGHSVIVPDLEGVLYLKENGKKSWKRRYFLLRASGIYYVPKGKTKSSSDLACFVHFDKVSIYTTSDYKQKYKAPTDHCFILKHPCIQMESQYIRFLCCEDEHTLSLWVASIRVAKYGRALHDNYKAAEKRSLSTWTTSPIMPLSTLLSQRATQPSADHEAQANGCVPLTSQQLDGQSDPPPDFTPPPPPGYGGL